MSGRATRTLIKDLSLLRPPPNPGRHLASLEHECAGNQGFRCMLVGTQDGEIEIRLSRFPGKMQNSS